MNGLIQDLVLELKTNTTIKDSVIVKLILEYINNSRVLGVSSDIILSTALTNLESAAVETVNENLKEVVQKFKKLADTPTKRLQNMAKEAGLDLKLKMLKESNVAKDPTFVVSVNNIEKMLTVVPEFRVIGPMFEAIKNYEYDPGVSKVLNDLTQYVTENRAKLEILNAIFEMRQTNSVMYKEAVSILEECLLSGELAADSIKMRMRGKVNMPIINRLVNTLSMVEARTEGKFNLGLGNGEVKVSSVITPFYKISDASAVILLEHAFVRLEENKDPEALTPDLVKTEYPDFYEVCEAFARLGFKERNNEIFCKGRNLEVAFAVNEAGLLQLKINNRIIDDLTKVDIAEIFMLEQIDSRSNLVKIFNNLDVIVNLEFAKRLVNERLNADSIVFTIGENQLVFEKLGNTRVIKKMQGIAFHSYVMENFNYDVSELYAIQLSERDATVKRLEEEKLSVDEDIKKLEKSITQLEEALSDSSLSSDYKVQLGDLKALIEKNIVKLKNHYVSLNHSKKKA